MVQQTCSCLLQRYTHLQSSAGQPSSASTSFRGLLLLFCLERKTFCLLLTFHADSREAHLTAAGTLLQSCTKTSVHHRQCFHAGGGCSSWIMAAPRVGKICTGSELQLPKAKLAGTSCEWERFELFVAMALQHFSLSNEPERADSLFNSRQKHTSLQCWVSKRRRIVPHGKQITDTELSRIFHPNDLSLTFSSFVVVVF